MVMEIAFLFCMVIKSYERVWSGVGLTWRVKPVEGLTFTKRNTRLGIFLLFRIFLPICQPGNNLLRNNREGVKITLEIQCFKSWRWIFLLASLIGIYPRKDKQNMNIVIPKHRKVALYKVRSPARTPQAAFPKPTKSKYRRPDKSKLLDEELVNTCATRFEK